MMKVCLILKSLLMRIKTPYHFLICLLFAMTILYPIGTIIAACLGYGFKLVSVPAFAVMIAVLSVYIVVMDLVFKKIPETKTIQILLAVIMPLALINAAFYIFVCSQMLVIVSALFFTGCCCFLTVKYGKPLVLKIVALALSALMVFPVGFVSYIALIFGNIGQNTVVQTVESPGRKYYAQVVDSDQGALGGGTLVDVYTKSGINFILFKIEKNPQRVYTGDWGEFEDMQIHWKNDKCLIINSVEYEIE